MRNASNVMQAMKKILSQKETQRVIISSDTHNSKFLKKAKPLSSAKVVIIQGDTFDKSVLSQKDNT